MQYRDSSGCCEARHQTLQSERLESDVFLPLLPLVLVNFVVVWYVFDLFVRLISCVVVQTHYFWTVHQLIEDQLESVSFVRIVSKAVGLHDQVGRGREQWVQANPQGIFDHGWYDPTEQRTRQLQTRVRVDFDEPGVEVLVDHEVHAKHFKIMLSLVLINCHERRSDGIRRYFLNYIWPYLHRWIRIGEEIILLTVFLFQVLLEVCIAQLVSLFVLPVLRQVLLDSVVGQVNPSCVWLESVLEAGRTDVALLIPVAPDDAIDARHHDVVSDVEFTTIVQKRTVKIWLHDVCFDVAIWVFFLRLYQSLDLVKGEADGDAGAPVGKFSRLDDPDIPFLLLAIRFLLLLLFDYFGPFVEVVQELHIGRVVQSRLNVECHWQIVRYVLLGQFVILAHRIK